MTEYAMRRDLPTGTVTLLFTDIEGSTKLLRDLGPSYAAALDEHRRIVRAALDAHGGVEVDTQGDAFFLAFPSADSAVSAAVEAQAGLAAGPIRVRMGLHTGEVERTAEGYVGLEVHRGARIAAAGHGSQVLLSATTRAALETPFELQDLGEHRLKDFDEPMQLWQVGDALFPPLRTIANTNLPRPVSSFVGRTAEVDALVRQIRDGARIVTLTGPGGTGKTRLAIEASTELLAEFKAGVFWIGLAVVRDPGLVMANIGQAIGASGTVAEHVQDREMLLVLDNLEQVVDAAGELSDLARACPNLVLLVTSRELLRIDGEAEFAVPALDIADARTLFAERSGTTDTSDLDQLCERLDNIPLALELAAALTRVLSPGQILQRLDQRLDLLQGGRDVDPRQRTLRSTIAWSHDLLDPTERALFAKLSVFRGGCTVESMEAICDASPVTLQSLVDKSLVRRTGDRFWMLETIRDFAAEQLRDSGAGGLAERAHYNFFLALAETANMSTEAERGRRRPELLRPETDNLRAALDWALLAGEIELGYRLAMALENFWVILDPFEGIRRFEALFAAGGHVPPIMRARALRCYGGSNAIAGRNAQARRAYDESLAIFKEVGQPLDLAVIQHRIASCLINTGQAEQARGLLEESLEIFERVGSPLGVAQALGAMGWVALDADDLEGAARLLRQSMELVRDHGWAWWQLDMLDGLAQVAIRRGSFEEAEAWAREALSLADQLADRQSAVFTIATLARCAAETGDSVGAGRLWGGIEAEEARSGLGQWESVRDEYAESIAANVDAAFERGRAEGHRMTLQQTVAAALAREEQR